jgi:hypothetical protein
MVKTCEQIQAKFALKFDAYVLMLRAKRLKYFSAAKYAETVFKQYSLEIAMNQAISDYDLAWGQTGRFYDLTQKLFSGKEVTLQKWLDSDLPEALYNKLPSIFASIESLYSFCKYPTSKLMSRIIVYPLSQDVLFPPEEDYVTQTTALSESETLDLLSEDSTASILEVQVCCHNVVNAILSMLPNPTVAQTETGVYPTLHITVANPNVYNETPTLNVSVANS